MLIACGGSTASSVLGENADASSAAPPSTGTTAANGTCHFTMMGGDRSGAPRSGTATARLNGSGNVIVRCAELREGREALELWIGNGTYDGARTYVLSEESRDGTAFLETMPKISYEPADIPGSSCTVIVSAPADEDPAGKTIQGTFSCKKLTHGASIMDVTDGAFSAVVR